jgi:hypothetical protein
MGLEDAWLDIHGPIATVACIRDQHIDRTHSRTTRAAIAPTDSWSRTSTSIPQNGAAYYLDLGDGAVCRRVFGLSLDFPV